MTARGDAYVLGVEMSNLGYGFDLRGDRDGLAQLAEAIRAPRRVIVGWEGGGEASLLISHSSGPVMISHDGPTAVVRGDASGIEKFALTMEVVAKEPSKPGSVGAHAHVEFYEGHPWLAECSEAVVVSLRE